MNFASCNSASGPGMAQLGSQSVVARWYMQHHSQSQKTHCETRELAAAAAAAAAAVDNFALDAVVVCVLNCVPELDFATMDLPLTLDLKLEECLGIP